MPRPRNHHGRPGTRVIPDRWDEHHAPIINRTRSGRCQIWAPADPIEIGDDLSYPDTPAREPVYNGTFRLQELSQSDRSELLGDQAVRVSSYLLVIGRPAAGIRRGSLVQVLESTDPDLLGSDLYVATITKGSHRWERDLTVVDDLSAIGGTP